MKLTDTIFSYQRSTVFAHPMPARQRQALIDASEPLDVWPIHVPGKAKAARMRAHRHPFQGIFYVPLSTDSAAA
jgi:hypothetical protein